MKNYYQILGIQSDATESEIKKAYKKLAKKFHPDVNEGDTYFENLFKDLQEANDCLSDHSSKKKYDNRHSDFFLTPKKIKQETTIVKPSTPVSEEQNSLTGMTVVIGIIVFVIIAVGIMQNANGNSTDNSTSTDFTVAIDSTAIDSAAIKNDNLINDDIQNVVVEPEPENVQIEEELSKEDEDKYLISLLEEHYEFYYRGKTIFRNPKIKKKGTNYYVVSLEENSMAEYKDNELFWKSRIIEVDITRPEDLDIKYIYL